MFRSYLNVSQTTLEPMCIPRRTCTSICPNYRVAGAEGIDHHCTQARKGAVNHEEKRCNKLRFIEVEKGTRRTTGVSRNPSCEDRVWQNCLACA